MAPPVTRTHAASSRYGPERTNVGRARAWAVAELRQHAQAGEQLLANVELVISELMTNAIKAGATEVSLTLEAGPRSVMISVHDDAGGRVALRTADPTATGGRGLPIVAALSTDWGVEIWSLRKRVWASLPIGAS
jgi:anti-sigma regulatory factor (Ser/Thr protein kinase)